MPRLHTIAFVLAGILLALLPFHAFLWTWFHSFFWTDSWTIIVQSWKELGIALLALLALVRLIQEPQSINRLRTPANLCALALVLLAMAYAAVGPGELVQRLYGLRTVILPLMIFLSIQFFDFSEQQRQRLYFLMLTSGALVVGFALLQQFVLPIDFLKSFGYSTVTSTWLPGGNLPMYQVVSDTNLIRAQSTFAGPNQLAGYLLIVVPIVFLELMQQLRRIDIRNFQFSIFNFQTISNVKFLKTAGWLVLLLATLATIFFTYSRSAWIALGAMLVLLALFYIHHRHARYAWRLTFGLLMAKILLATIMFTQLPTDWEHALIRSASTSDHFTRTMHALEVTATHPLGLGLGSTAGVSQRFDSDTHTGLTPENTYLGYALELGWVGGLLLIGFLSTLFWQLSRVQDPLALSIAGLAVIALVLHPFEDTPTAITLFLLAGLSMKHEATHPTPTLIVKQTYS